MAIGSETFPLKGKVTLESIVESIVDVSWRIANMKERMASVEGTCVKSGRPRVLSQEPTTKGMTDGFVGCSNIQGKEYPSCGRQGTIANLNTFTIANEQSVNVSLSLSETIDSLPYIDNVLVEYVDTLVDPIDDRIDSFSKIDLCPPSIDTYALKNSTLFGDNRVDQPACECSSLVDGPCNVIKEPQVTGTNDTVDQFNRSDSMGICFVEDPIACFAHRDYVLENASKNDMCLFEDDEITPSDVPSGVNLESNIFLDSYTCYNYPLWCEAFPPKDGNLFLKDESSLVGKEGDEEEGDVCFAITSSSWCVSLLNGKLFLGFCHPLEEPTLCVGKDSFLDLFSIFYPEHDLVECVSHGVEDICQEKGTLEVYTCWYDPIQWTFYPFDLGGCLRVFELVGVSSFGGYYHVDEKNNHCPCSPFVGLIAMTIDEVWLFLEFESPRLNVLSANFCTTHHAKRISFLLMIYMVLQGLDSRTHLYLLAYDDTHTCGGCISYVSSGLNWANESLLDSMLYDPFPFDPSTVLKCAECGSNTFCHLHDSSVVLLFDPIYLNEVCLPIWVGDTYVLEPAHELEMITLLKLSSASDGILTGFDTTYAFALRYESILLLLDIREALSLFGYGTNKGLHMRLFKCIGSFALPLCISY
uniref:Uncharacterized protein n=1 Tax=Solanum tuberosum TaxID=4113 RepID=M1DHL1_SOLTU